MAAKAKARGKDRTPKRFSLYWVTTEDGSEDCFVGAATAGSAARFLEDIDGYDRGDAGAELVIDLPDELQNGRGWRAAPTGEFDTKPYYASDALILACGGEIAEQRTDPLREMLGEMTKDYRFGQRHFRPGDVVTTVRHGLGAPESARRADRDRSSSCTCSDAAREP